MPVIDETSMFPVYTEKQTKYINPTSSGSSNNVFSVYLYAYHRDRGNMQSPRMDWAKIPVACTEINNTLCFHFFILFIAGQWPRRWIFRSVTLNFLCFGYVLALCVHEFKIAMRFWMLMMFFGFIFVFVCLFRCAQRVIWYFSCNIIFWMALPIGG